MYMLFWNLRCDNYSRETTIQGRKLFAEIRYVLKYKLIKSELNYVLLTSF